MQIVVFRLGPGEYALPVEHVREIVPYRAPRTLPATRPWELGVVSLRQHVVPVWDLATRLGLPASEPGAATVFVVAEGDEPGVDEPIALVVDAVGGIHQVPGEAFEPLPLFPDALGVAHLGGELVVVLDLDKLVGRTQPEPVQQPAPPISQPIPQPRAPSLVPEPPAEPNVPCVDSTRGGERPGTAPAESAPAPVRRPELHAVPTPPDILDGLPKHELQRRARQAGVAGRSSMDREELIAALRRR